MWYHIVSYHSTAPMITSNLAVRGIAGLGSGARPADSRGPPCDTPSSPNKNPETLIQPPPLNSYFYTFSILSKLWFSIPKWAPQTLNWQIIIWMNGYSWCVFLALRCAAVRRYLVLHRAFRAGHLQRWWLWRRGVTWSYIRHFAGDICEQWICSIKQYTKRAYVTPNFRQ